MRLLHLSQKVAIVLSIHALYAHCHVAIPAEILHFLLWVLHTLLSSILLSVYRYNLGLSVVGM